ncbi:hypothetical protein QUF76_10625, partial [Desulfobacterales bacterium HSG16]|nr:hypothetical protein [Desulfobacterales bacterium HSG16]
SDEEKLFASVKLIKSEKEEFTGAKGNIDLMKFQFECNRDVTKKKDKKNKKKEGSKANKSGTAKK